jgi:hypothetical protein
MNGWTGWKRALSEATDRDSQDGGLWGERDGGCETGTWWSHQLLVASEGHYMTINIHDHLQGIRNSSYPS